MHCCSCIPDNGWQVGESKNSMRRLWGWQGGRECGFEWLIIKGGKGVKAGWLAFCVTGLSVMVPMYLQKKE